MVDHLGAGSIRPIVPQPYAQLAATLIASGERGAADDIRYLGLVRQRESEHWEAWIVSGFLQYVAGFGIGTYTFRVCVLGSSASPAAAALISLVSRPGGEDGPPRFHLVRRRQSVPPVADHRNQQGVR